VAKGIKIIEVENGSLAAELELAPGDLVSAVNGKRVRDALDFKFKTSGEDDLTLNVIKPDGEEWEILVEKDEEERWGIEFEPMTPRQCGNDCIFCFIQQNPAEARPSLFVRDEDVRFSFMYGNYTTLTTISKSEVERVIEQRLSPQYVSVHTTDPELRAYMLGVEKQDDVMARMRHFIENGIEIHAQIVLCPTINDGPHLTKTIENLASLHPGLVSTAIVPLGITDNHKYRDRLTAVTDNYCREIIAQVEPIQRQLRSRLGSAFAFLGDEFYIRAGLPVPPRSHYRIVRGAHAAGEEHTYPQIEDGVGMVRQFFEQHAARMRKLARMRKQGNFSPDDAASVHGTVATGEIFHPMLAQAIGELNEEFGTRLRSVAVKNIFFGAGVTVAGLLSGIDFLNAREEFKGQFLMIPPDCFRKHDQRFLDGGTVGELSAGLNMPIRSSWNSIFGLPEAEASRNLPVLSHNYGSVTSISA
jgi:putative radical SAM enzyme (TIGR03279 family)